MISNQMKQLQSVEKTSEGFKKDLKLRTIPFVVVMLEGESERT